MMKQRKSLVSTMGRAFLLSLIFLAGMTSARAQTTIFTYQGRLTEASAAASGTYDFQFALFDAQSGGTQQGVTLTRTGVPATNGVFTVPLDFGSNPFTAGADRYLEIGVKKPADAVYTTLSPRQQLTATPFAIQSLNATLANGLSANCVACVTNAQINSLDGAKVTGTVANATNALTANTATTATNNVLKSGDTMTGVLNLTTNGLTVGSSQIQMAGSGNVGIGSAPSTITSGDPQLNGAAEKFAVNGNVSIPATSNYLYKTAKTYSLKIGSAALVSANPTVYESRIDDGFSSATVNGLGSHWATGGTAGQVAYFIAPVNLPNGAAITGLAAQLIKNGGSLQSVVELYRSDGSGYLNSTAQLIATATTITSGGIVFTVTASSVNTSFNVVDNPNYQYFIRWSGEQNTQNVRFQSATITYQVSRPE